MMMMDEDEDDVIMEPGKITHTPFDAAEYLNDAGSQAAYLSDALKTGHKEMILHALNTLARARGTTSLARSTGVKREALYAALGEGGNPTLETLLALINGLGVTLRAEVAEAEIREPVPA